MVINRVRVLGSGPHIPISIFFLGVPRLVLYKLQTGKNVNNKTNKLVTEIAVLRFNAHIKPANGVHKLSS